MGHILGRIAEMIDSTALKSKFGKRLRELRVAAGLSQEALADAAGLDRTYVSKCERGGRNVTLLSIHKFAKALKVEPATLLQESKPK